MRRYLPWLAVLSLGACGDPLEKRSLLTEYRVIGIAADRPDVSPDDAVALRVFDFDPASVGTEAPASEPYYLWVVCAYSLGSLVQYDCADPQLEVVIRTAGPELALDLSQPLWDGRDLRTVYEEAQAQLDAARAAGVEVPISDDAFDLSKGVRLTIKLFSGREGAGYVDSVKEILVRDTDEPRNQNPGIVAFRIGGERAVRAVPTEEELLLEVETAPGSAQTYVDGETGEEVEEELLYSWFTSGGDLDPERTFADRSATRLTAPDDPQKLRLFVAVRDGRGGLAVAEHTVEVLAPRAR